MMNAKQTQNILYVSRLVMGSVVASAYFVLFHTIAHAAYQLPEGEKITNPIVIGRGIPQKEAYEPFDPKTGRNFDLKNLWMRADLRVRPEYHRKSTR